MNKAKCYLIISQLGFFSKIYISRISSYEVYKISESKSQVIKTKHYFNFFQRSVSSIAPDKSRSKSFNFRRSLNRTRSSSSRNFSKSPTRPEGRRKSTNFWRSKIGSNKPSTFWTKIESEKKSQQSKPTISTILYY